MMIARNINKKYNSISNDLAKMSDEEIQNILIDSGNIHYEIGGSSKKILYKYYER